MPSTCPLNLAHIPDAFPGNSCSAAPHRILAFLHACVRECSQGGLIRATQDLVAHVQSLLIRKNWGEIKSEFPGVLGAKHITALKV